METETNNSEDDKVRDTDTPTNPALETLSDRQVIQMLDDEWKVGSAIPTPNILIVGKNFARETIEEFAEKKAKELGKKLISNISFGTKNYIDVRDAEQFNENIKNNVLNEPHKYFIYIRERFFFYSGVIYDNFYSQYITCPGANGILHFNDFNCIKDEFFYKNKKIIYSLLGDRRIVGGMLSEKIMIVTDAYRLNNPAFVDMSREDKLLSLFHKVNYQLSASEWLDRNSGELDHDLLEFIKQSPDENLGVFESQDPRAYEFLSPWKVMDFNRSLAGQKKIFEKSSWYEHEKIFENIYAYAANFCGTLWADRFLDFFKSRKR